MQTKGGTIDVSSLSFQCDGCGDIIKKPKLKQHQQRCHSSFTCIDCSTTFNGMSYQSHISCITEKQKFQKHLHKKQDVVKTEVTKTTEILVKDKPVSLIEQIKATKRKGDSMEEIKVTKRKTESIQESAVMTEEDQLDSCIREILSNGMATKEVEDCNLLILDSWRRVTALAHDHAKDLEIAGRNYYFFHRSIYELEPSIQSEVVRRRGDYFTRQMELQRSFDLLFMLTQEDGFQQFINLMVAYMYTQNSLDIAFVNHIIHKTSIPSPFVLIHTSGMILCMIRNLFRLDHFYKYRTEEFTRRKLNAAVLWAVLADRFAGDQAFLLWDKLVGDFLVRAILDKRENMQVRIFCLLAIEKFCASQDSTLFQGSVRSAFLEGRPDFREKLNDVIKGLEAGRYKRGMWPGHTTHNIFETRLILIGDESKDIWSKHCQLTFCARWLLNRELAIGKLSAYPFFMGRSNVVWNPFDSTPNMKLGSNGLEIRNDGPNLESIRATANVRSGKWYYEVMLITSGVMQIGWAASRTKFSPENGEGVGDDDFGCAFDPYRTAIWKQGDSDQPQRKIRGKCRPYDVVGCYIDFDRQMSTYFVNGKDIGMSVPFELEKPDENRPTISIWDYGIGEIDLDELKIYDDERASTSPDSTSSDSTSFDSTSSDSTSSEPSTSGLLLPELSLPEFSLPEPSSSESSSSEPTPHYVYPKAQINALVVSLTEQGRKIEQAPLPPVLKTTCSASLKKVYYGLYPAISLSTHQQVVVNFGEKSWFCPPPITDSFRSMHEAGKLDDLYKKRVKRWLQLRGCTNKGRFFKRDEVRPYRPGDKGELSDDEDENLEWDGPLCTLCFSEPKNARLMPCNHDEIGMHCARLLFRW
ncbi:hypothetical protein BDB01DRAFT_839341 [Pilobolus umbonatus]|nr:hypothetical protein BDB01DRAFT_839341 [Pilobolus umbonatus]